MFGACSLQMSVMFMLCAGFFGIFGCIVLWITVDNIDSRLSVLR